MVLKYSSWTERFPGLKGYAMSDNGCGTSSSLALVREPSPTASCSSPCSPLCCIESVCHVDSPATTRHTNPEDVVTTGEISGCTTPSASKPQPHLKKARTNGRPFSLNIRFNGKPKHRTPDKDNGINKPQQQDRSSERLRKTQKFTVNKSLRVSNPVGFGSWVKNIERFMVRFFVCFLNMGVFMS